MGEIPDVSLREFFSQSLKNIERIVDERDRQYDMRFRASEIAVNAALAAQQKSTADAFIASEKAIVKAEEAQKDYNARSNEFRGQLDDQAKQLMARAEALNLLKASDDKLETMRLFFDSKLESQRLNFEKSHEALASEVGVLRTAFSAQQGKSTGMSSFMTASIAITGIVLALISIVVVLIVHFA